MHPDISTKEMEVDQDNSKGEHEPRFLDLPESLQEPIYQEFGEPDISNQYLEPSYGSLDPTQKGDT